MEEGNEESVEQSKTNLDELETVIIDGEEIPVAELKQARMRHADYTKKTQDLAKERNELEDLREAAEAKGQEYVKALEADIEFYNTTPRENWVSYTPKINELLGIPSKPSGGDPKMAQDPKPATPTVDTEIVEDVKSIKSTLDKQEADRAKAALDKQVDDLLAHVQAEIKANPLADVDLVYNKIEAYQLANKGALPTHDDASKFVKEVHEKFVSAGARVPAGEKKTSTAPDVEPGSAPMKEPPKHKGLSLSDADSVEIALEDHIDQILAAKES